MNPLDIWWNSLDGEWSISVCLHRTTQDNRLKCVHPFPEGIHTRDPKTACRLDHAAAEMKSMKFRIRCLYKIEFYFSLYRFIHAYSYFIRTEFLAKVSLAKTFPAVV
jgi:hypothetical protein